MTPASEKVCVSTRLGEDVVPTGRHVFVSGEIAVALVITLLACGHLEQARLTVCQDIEALLAVHKVLDRLLDGRKISQVNVQELQAAVRVWVSLLDLLNSGVCFALRASSYVDSAVVLVEDLAQLFANAYQYVSTTGLCDMDRSSDLPA